MCAQRRSVNGGLVVTECAKWRAVNTGRNKHEEIAVFSIGRMGAASAVNTAHRDRNGNVFKQAQVDPHEKTHPCERRASNSTDKLSGAETRRTEVKMSCVYHLKPRTMIGDELYPLNELKRHHPELYGQHLQKYRGRHEAIERYIPLLDCFWNDVIFFTSVHPQAIKSGHVAAGKQWKPQQWFVVDPGAASFSSDNSVVYHPDMTQPKGDMRLMPQQFAPFVVNELETIYELPDATQQYYREASERNESIFAWRGLPHILHRGSVSIKDIEILTI
jgi:hypothetical protein